MKTDTGEELSASHRRQLDLERTSVEDLRVPLGRTAHWEEMIQSCLFDERWMTRVWSSGVAVLLAFALPSCGGTNATQRSQPHQRIAERSVRQALGTDRPAARIPPAQPVPLAEAPPSLLAVCLKNSLLRPICPRLGPLANEPHTSVQPLGFCITRAGRDLVVAGHFARLASSRCVDAGWGYEAVGWPPGFTASRGITWIRGWDPFTRMLAPPEALLITPPVHVHIEIEASLGSLIGASSWPSGAHQVNDTLLSPKRAQPASLGWVRWYGRDGQLVLEPVYPFGGEWGGHLIFHFIAGRVTYAVTLHAWMPVVRFTGSGVDRFIGFQSGPALPHVIATLKAMVASASRR